MPARGRPAPRPASSTPSSPAACSATPASGSPPWSRRCWGSGCARSTPRPTGRRARCPRRGWSTPPSTSRSSSSCASHMATELEQAGKAEWARQEFDHLLGFEPAVRVDAWRRTSGVHRLRGRRALGAARALWEARDAIAAERDVTPGRILPDSAIVVAATAMPTDRRALLATQGFHGRGAEPLRHRPGSRRCARSARWPRTSCPPAPRAATAPRTRAPGPTATRSPTAASRPPARRCSTSPRCTTCRWRTSSPPTTSAG